MSTPDDDRQTTLTTPAGDFPLSEYHLRLAGREWTVLHTGALVGFWEEQRFLSEPKNRVSYGLALWPAAIALAHDVAARAGELAGRRVLELGAGTGLPGIVAASLGARVVQTDRNEPALALARRNAERNGGAVASRVEHRLADWEAWDDAARYDVILGADVLYAERVHAELRRIFETNLAPGGRVLLADPFRSASLRLLEAMEADGWRVGMSKWNVAGGAEDEEDEDEGPRPIGVFELVPPPR